MYAKNIPARLYDYGEACICELMQRTTNSSRHSDLHMEIALPRGDDQSMKYTKVIKQLKDENGLPIGTANKNPILDSRLYEVKWLDGSREEMFANTIAETYLHRLIMKEIDMFYLMTSYLIVKQMIWKHFLH
jgi:hypothetical protein